MKESTYQIGILTVILTVIPIALYIGIALMVFEYRNPLSNKMSLFRHFKAVMTFKTMNVYQLPQTQPSPQSNRAIEQLREEYNEL